MGVLATTAAKGLAWLELQRGGSSAGPVPGVWPVFLDVGPDMRALISGPSVRALS